RIEVPGNEGPLTLVGVHLSTSEAAGAQAEFLAEMVKEHSPHVIAGDFNSTPDSQAVQAVVKRGFIEARPGNLGAEPRIDHVFLSPMLNQLGELREVSWVPTSRPVVGVREAISDHDGILVELSRH